MISWFITANPVIGIKIGAAEILTKMVLYYFHERVWFKLNLSQAGIIKKSRIRHLAKTFTWRGIGTADTMILAWLISGNPFSGLKIGLSELMTKMILYYFHERVWYRLDYGLKD